MSNSSLKQIVISPELFKIKNNKTRKLAPVPMINPNVVKNKLLTRIKEHKKAEHSINPNKPHNANTGGSQIKNSNGRVKGSRFNPIVMTPGPKTPKDEFNDSLNYFSQLKQNDVIERNNSIIQRKTVKRYPDVSPSSSHPMVNLELPAELQPAIPFMPPPPVSSLPINLKYNVDQTVPYGCLKGGIKPTYKNLYTRRNIPGQQHVSVTMQPQPAQNDLARQQKLADLQQRMNQKPAINSIHNPPPMLKAHPVPLAPPLAPLAPAPVSAPVQPHNSNHNTLPMNENALPESLMDLFPELKNETVEGNEKRLEKTKKEEKLKQMKQSLDVANAGPITIDDVLPPNKKKQKVHKTIKRRYTVGRNLKTNTVGVLIKDNYTRKMVTNAHKEMKKKTIHELKKELRGHNLIKAGCSAPNDVLRSIYEHSKLAGEIVNTNADMLMHNFVNAEQT